MFRETKSPARDEMEIRLKQQSMLADFGRRALAIDDLDVLLRETAVLVAQGLGTEMSKVMELQPDGDLLLLSPLQAPRTKLLEQRLVHRRRAVRATSDLAISSRGERSAADAASL